METVFYDFLKLYNGVRLQGLIVCPIRPQRHFPGTLAELAHRKGDIICIINHDVKRPRVNLIIAEAIKPFLHIHIVNIIGTQG